MPAVADQPRRHKRAVVAAMRNEGLWLLEWIAFHKAIGFDTIFVASNDCTDGSDRMLARLDEIGEVIHLPNDAPPPGISPQEAGCALALAHPAMAEVEWLLHIDADEFLNITAGAGRIDDLIAVAPEADCINIVWKMFGSGGRRFWEGGSVLETFTRTEQGLRRRKLPLGKSLFRPDRFDRIYSHQPKKPRAADVVLTNTSGRVMPSDALFRPRMVRHQTTLPRYFTWDNAAINHYAIRSLDVFLLKNHRGDGLGIEHRKYRQGSPFWQSAERNEATDESILRHLPAMQDILTRLRADPPIADLEAAALSAFRDARRRLLIEDGLYGWNDPPPAEVTEAGLPEEEE